MVTAVEVADVAMAAEAEAAATAGVEVVTAVEVGVAATAVALAVPVATTTAAKSNPFGFKRGGGKPPPRFFYPLPPLTSRQLFHRLDRIRLFGLLIRPHPDNPRKA